jgi:ribonuclease PH
VRDGNVLLDLDYPEDVSVDVDFNVVMTGSGRLIEVQGTAEHAPFTREDLNGLVDAAAAGIDELVGLQRRAVAG